MSFCVEEFSLNLLYIKLHVLNIPIFATCDIWINIKSIMIDVFYIRGEKTGF